MRILLKKQLTLGLKEPSQTAGRVQDDT